MKMEQFIEEYCKDIKSEDKVRSSENVYNRPEFSFDVIQGGQKFVEADDGTLIPVQIIIETSREDFKHQYRSIEALEMYDKYLDRFTIVSGPELLQQLANDIKISNERVKMYNTFGSYD